MFLQFQPRQNVANISNNNNNDDAARLLLARIMDLKRPSLDFHYFMRVIAFWFYLEPLGFHGIIMKIAYGDTTFLNLVYNEAMMVLSSLQHPRSTTTAVLSRQNNIFRATLFLAHRFVSVGAIFADGERVLRGVMEIYRQVCCPLFKDMLEERGFRVVDAIASSSSSFKLNPNATEWNPSTHSSPEHDRILFITFSNGLPLQEEEIIQFFTSKFGQCVDKVFVHRPRTEDLRLAPSLFGKVYFKMSWVPAVILRGRNEVRFRVNRKPLWCKKFEPNRDGRNN